MMRGDKKMNNNKSNNPGQKDVSDKDFKYYWDEIIRALITMK